MPIPMVVPVIGISTISTPTEKTTESQDVPVIAPRCCHLTPMLDNSSAPPLPSTISSSSSLPSKSASYTVVVIPELAIPVKAYP